MYIKFISLIEKLFRVNNSKNIFVRKFSGSSVPLCSPFGKILINSIDSKVVAMAVRASIKGKEQTIQLSQDTLNRIKLAKNK